MEILIARTIKSTLISAAIIAIVSAVFKNIIWAGGFLTGVGWSTINFLFTLNILKIALLQREKTKMSLLLLAKFPVLYLLGFIILASGIFPVSSLLSGAGLIFVAIGVNKLYLRLN